MQIHLFKKVYLSFDFMFRPVFNSLVVSKNYYGPHQSFMNKHVGMAMHYGNFDSFQDVDWHNFFVNGQNTRTVIYADGNNFAGIYFSFLKTVKPYIKKSAAKKILEIILKHFEFTSQALNTAENKQHLLPKMLADTRAAIDQAWINSKPFDLQSDWVTTNLGIEFLAARYWADRRDETQLKTKLQEIWWKIFVHWGEELKKMRMTRWFYSNPNSSYQEMMAEYMTNPDLTWLSDPMLSDETVEQFKQDKDWSVIKKMYQQISAPDGGLIIDFPQQWQDIVALDWNKILDQNNPMSLLITCNEPGYRFTINGWLIGYFAAQSERTLKEMVV